MLAALRQFIEVDTHKALVSVKLLDEHCAVKELVCFASHKAEFSEAKIQQGHEELTSGHHED